MAQQRAEIGLEPVINADRLLAIQEVIEQVTVKHFLANYMYTSGHCNL